MKIIRHKDRPALDFPDECWRPTLRMAINRSAGSETLSVWLADMEHHQRTPLHWHDTEEVLMFLEVDGDGFARVGDEEFKIESQTSVVVPPEPCMPSGCATAKYSSRCRSYLTPMPCRATVLWKRVKLSRCRN